MTDREKKAEYDRAYRATHREQKAAKERARYAAHREEVAGKRAAYRAANREKIAASDRAYRATHQVEIAASKRPYRNTHRAEQVAYNLKWRHGITQDEFDGLGDYQEWLCAGCGAPITPLTAQIDHDHSCCPGKRSCGKCIRGLVCRACNVRDALGTAA